MTKKSIRRPSRKLRALVVGAIALGSTVIASGLPAAQAAQRSAAPSTLTFWVPFSGPDGNAMKTIVSKFNASHKDVQINMTINPNGNYAGALTTPSPPTRPRTCSWSTTWPWRPTPPPTS